MGAVTGPRGGAACLWFGEVGAQEAAPRQYEPSAAALLVWVDNSEPVM